MRNVKQLKGNKLAAVFRHNWNLSTFLFSNKKCHKKIVFNLVFAEIPKWGLPCLYLLYLKNRIIIKLRLLFRHYPVGLLFSNYITLRELCLNLFTFSILKWRLDLALLPIGHLKKFCAIGFFNEGDALESSSILIYSQIHISLCTQRFDWKPR